MQLVIDPCGTGHCLYSESIEIHTLGCLTIRRASQVEPNADGTWTADLTPVAGPQLGPFQLRSQALAAEADWLERYRLDPAYRSF